MSFSQTNPGSLSTAKELLLYGFLYLVGVTAITFMYFAADKRKARRGVWRVPEATLLWLCAIGGSIGGGLAIWGLRHKCSKPSFMLPYYLIVALQLVAIAAFLWIGPKKLLDFLSASY